MERIYTTDRTLTDLELQLLGFRLTTAEITYRLPDYPDLLQIYIWQHLDLNPDFPHLCEFLHFWEVNLEGRLYHVKVAHTELLKPSEIRSIDMEFSLKPH